MCSSLEKISLYDKQLKPHLYESESSSILSIMEILTRSIFDIALDPVSGKDLLIWEQINTLYQRINDNKGLNCIAVFVRVWQSSILSLTNDLVDALYNIPDNDYEVLSDPLIIPFKGLSMKNEYVLQILFNAFSSHEDPKYSKVIRLNLYVHYLESWMRLLDLLKVNPKNNKILSHYIESIILFIISS